jgi:hypothetical protein
LKGPPAPIRAGDGAQALEEKLREKDGVIAEPAQEVMTLKKILLAGTREGEDEP